MNNYFTKILLLLGISTILFSCNTTKRVPEGKLLLIKNEVLVNGKAVSNDTIAANLIQKPNKKFIKGVPFLLYLYNMTKVDSNGNIKNKGFSKFFKKNGEAPVIISSKRAKKTATRLKKYYFNKGYFNTKTSYKIDTVSSKKGKITYNITTKSPYTVNAFTKEINSPVLDSIYQKHKDNSFVKTNKQYNRYDLANERERLATIFANNGIFQFLPEYIKFEGDSIDQFNHIKLNMKVQDRPVKINGQTQTFPFEISKINKINIYTDHTYKKSKLSYQKTATYNGIDFFSHKKLKYKPKSLASLISIKNGDIFKEHNKRVSYDQLYRLNNFKTISIKYTPVANDTLNKLLDVGIYLTPYKPFKFGIETEAITSDIKKIGLSGLLNFTSRNIFKGAEMLNFGLSTTVSSSVDRQLDTNFFNILEFGGNLSLKIPRMLFFTKTSRWIPAEMFPSTQISTGLNYQKNIGLDKQEFNTSIQYNWTPAKTKSSKLKLVEIQFIKNVKPEQFFYTYQSTFKELSSTTSSYPNNTSFLDSDGNLKVNSANDYINATLNDSSWPTTNTEIAAYTKIKSIEERRIRLTENNLILGSSFTYSKNNQQGINDNSFYFYKIKVEGAGNLLKTISKLSNRLTNNEGQYEILGIPFSHYIKTDLEYRKHWALNSNQVLAFRAFGGIAIPLENSKGSIPFSKSYFAGGANFNRAWEAYKLGPGTTSQINDFNEANMKLEFNLEYRFPIFGIFNGALFADAGNIWMTNDNLGEEAKFQGIKSLNDLAIGTGIGIRINIKNLFVARVDFGTKAYDPSKTGTDRWIKDIDIAELTTNIGINYPF